jgi:hypothetical protein
MFIEYTILQFSASLGSKPAVLLSVENLIWQCVLRVASGGDAVEEIGKLTKECHSILLVEEKAKASIEEKHWFTKGAYAFICYLLLLIKV